MGYACHFPEDRISGGGVGPVGDADRPFEQTMSELRALAHAASLPDSVPPWSERPTIDTNRRNS